MARRPGEDPRRLRAHIVVLGLLAGGALLPAAEFDQAHALFARVLTNYVASGRVDYAQLKSHRADLEDYLDQVAMIGKEEFESWNKNQQLAFLLNLYNAATLRLIVDHYPVKSIKDIGGFLSSPWDQKVVKLFGGTISLDYLEHQIIRKRFAEARVHFALVCAARGCPPLRSEPYVGAKLSEQLDDQARRFLADASQNRIVPEEKTAWLSPIFKWYRADFERQGGNVLDTLRTYWPGTATNLVETTVFKIRYTDYDWSLNETNRLDQH